MDLEDDLEQAVKRAVAACVSNLGLRQPSAEEIDEAVFKARNYAPQTKKPDDKKSKKKEEKQQQPTPRYFGLLPEVDFRAVIEKRMEEAEAEGGKAFWNALVTENRVTQRPHVTFVHKNSLPGAVELWERCAKLHSAISPPFFSFALGHLVWNERVMALTVDDFELGGSADGGQEGSEFVSTLSKVVRESLHITVGTSKDGIPPFEAKALVEDWRSPFAWCGVS